MDDLQLHLYNKASKLSNTINRFASYKEVAKELNISVRVLGRLRESFDLHKGAIHDERQLNYLYETFALYGEEWRRINIKGRRIFVSNYCRVATLSLDSIPSIIALHQQANNIYAKIRIEGKIVPINVPLEVAKAFIPNPNSYSMVHVVGGVLNLENIHWVNKRKFIYRDPEHIRHLLRA